MNSVKSAYIHIPFCNSICSYCDFCKIYYNGDIVSRYLKALEKEIKSYYKNEKLNTIYIGGGTPSSLNINELKELFKIIDILKKENNCEITFECNIDSIDLAKLKFLYEKGVNRLSIGIESFNKDIIKYLNRKHTKEEAINKVSLAKKVGFNNINIDLMYAIPIENMDILKEDLKTIISMDVEHISTYSLIIEPHTILYNNKADYIDQDIDFEMYKLICKELKEKNYIHYEISNFAKKGYESRHNIVYWNNMNYYGFGVGASGYINNIRYDNTKSISKYIDGNYVLKKDILNFNTIIENEFILGLRKIKGIRLSEFKEKYGFDVTDIPIVLKLIDEKKLNIKNDYLYIYNNYIYQENDILVEFLDIDYEIVKNNI